MAKRKTAKKTPLKGAKSGAKALQIKVGDVAGSDIMNRIDILQKEMSQLGNRINEYKQYLSNANAQFQGRSGQLKELLGLLEEEERQEIIKSWQGAGPIGTVPKSVK